MTITDTVYAETREDWRVWLEAHHATAEEIWLVTYRKAVGRPSVAYNDAVEEALCVGWIDGIRKSLGEDRLAQRFTPRRAGSGYSQTNKERLARLLDQGRVLPSVVARLKPSDRADAYVFPNDILNAIRERPEAWAFFQTCSAPYQRIRVAYIETARKRPDAFTGRLDSLLAACEAGRHIGYHIESFY
ncbi:MAG: YdeI/OmpD-associated family protein [Bacteroidota bacterium]